MNKYKILYAEDNATLAFLTKDNLEQHHYLVTHCNNGETCLEAFKKDYFDIYIFDIMLPNKDGFELAAAIRKKDTNIPIFFLSAKTLREDRIKGLKTGADDYLTKPFSIKELLFKIEIFIKRSQKMIQPEPILYKIVKYSFDSKNYIVFTNDEKIMLTQREAELLTLFVNNKNNVLKRETILTSLWVDDDYFMGRSLDVFISRLRKIFANETTVTIENLHDIGFKLVSHE